MSKKINEVVPAEPEAAPAVVPAEADAQAAAKAALDAIGEGLVPTATALKKTTTYGGLLKPHETFAAAVSGLADAGFSFTDILRGVAFLLQVIREVGPNVADIIEKFKKLYNG